MVNIMNEKVYNLFLQHLWAIQFILCPTLELLVNISISLQVITSVKDISQVNNLTPEDSSIELSCSLRFNELCNN